MFTSSFIFGIAAVHTSAAYIISRFLIGWALAAFVTCQFWTSIMFSPNVVGFANALAGGWGNAGKAFIMLQSKMQRFNPMSSLIRCACIVLMALSRRLDQGRVQLMCIRCFAAQKYCKHVWTGVACQVVVLPRLSCHIWLTALLSTLTNSAHGDGPSSSLAACKLSGL